MEVVGVVIGVGALILFFKYPEVMRVVGMIAAALMFIIGVFKAIP